MPLADDLQYLMDEVCSGLEIYYSGRRGGQYLKTAFILCDDYTELLSKVYLKHYQAGWSDIKTTTKKGHQIFKNYHEILNDLEASVHQSRAADLAALQTLTTGMRTRRARRNDFFHTTQLLDLVVNARSCVDAFCDLLACGSLLFAGDWRTAMLGSRNVDAMEMLLLLEKRGYTDDSIQRKLDSVLRSWPRNVKNVRKTGTHVSEFPDDLHLRLCIMFGGSELRSKLQAI